MNKPDTPLHDRNYAADWKAWIREYLKTQEYTKDCTSKEEVMRGVMKETRGLINPNWVVEVWDE